jgi:hypothetical protein
MPHAFSVRHFSRRTEQAYTYWIHQFILFHGKRQRMEMGAVEVGAYLPGWQRNVMLSPPRKIRL